MSYIAKTGIVTKLRGDATLMSQLIAGTASVYNGVGAQDSVGPKITLHKQAGTPTYTLASKAWDDDIYTIKAVTKGSSMLTAGSIAERIETVLVDQAISLASGSAIYLRKVSDIEYQETGEGGVIYSHIGAMYKLRRLP